MRRHFDPEKIKLDSLSRSVKPIRPWRWPAAATAKVGGLSAGARSAQKIDERRRAVGSQLAHEATRDAGEGEGGSRAGDGHAQRAAQDARLHLGASFEHATLALSTAHAAAADAAASAAAAAATHADLADPPIPHFPSSASAAATTHSAGSIPHASSGSRPARPRLRPIALASQNKALAAQLAAQARPPRGAEVDARGGPESLSRAVLAACLDGRGGRGGRSVRHGRSLSGRRLPHVNAFDKPISR